MLNEGRRAKDRGRDVVVGFVETHNRPLTAEAIGDLEVMPRTSISYRDTTFEEMDVDAIIARRPERALVDELAHTNIPGSRNEKRWQDVEELLAAGIDVTSTLNIQHLESLNDVVERITGIKQRETIPDEIVRAAEQVELVDITPEALRRRMVHGNIYAPDKIDASLANYFRAGNLGALRELALLWVADKVDVGPRGVPRTTRDHQAVGDAGAGRRRGHGRSRHRGADPPRCAHRPAGARRAARRARDQRRGTRRPVRRAARPTSQAARGRRRRVPRGGRRRRRRRPRRVRHGGERDAARARRQSPLALGGAAARLGDQPGGPSLRADRRARHLPRGRPRAVVERRAADLLGYAACRSRRCRPAGSSPAGCWPRLGSRC